MPTFLRLLKLKLITGYILLVTLFGMLLTLLVHARRKEEQTDRRFEDLVEQRAETERVLLDLLDLVNNPLAGNYRIGRL